MQAETIGLASAVAGSTVAALGLLHSWQREYGKKSPRLVRTIAIVIVTMGAAGLASVFRLDSAGSGNQTSRLTKSEYRQKAGAACVEGRDAALRLRSLEPRQPVGGLTVRFEQAALDRVAQLEPPTTFAKTHRRAVALWKRRVVLLGLAFREPHDLPPNGLAETDQLARDLAQIFTRLGVPECRI
jgi:hypothetical protein